MKRLYQCVEAHSSNDQQIDIATGAGSSARHRAKHARQINLLNERREGLTQQGNNPMGLAEHGCQFLEQRMCRLDLEAHLITLLGARYQAHLGKLVEFAGNRAGLTRHLPCQLAQMETGPWLQEQKSQHPLAQG